MAETQGVSKNTVNRLWQLHNIKPHLSRTFKLSRDAKFLEADRCGGVVYELARQGAAAVCG